MLLKLYTKPEIPIYNVGIKNVAIKNEINKGVATHE